MHGPLMNMLPGKDREEVAHLLSRLQQTTPTTNKQTLQQTNKSYNKQTNRKRKYKHNMIKKFKLQITINNLPAE